MLPFYFMFLVCSRMNEKGFAWVPYMDILTMAVLTR